MLVAGDGQKDAVVDGDGAREESGRVPARDSDVFGVTAQRGARRF